MMLFRMPAFFRSSNASSASVGSHGVAASQPPIAPAATTEPVTELIAEPVAESVVEPAAEHVFEPVADTVEQIHEVPAHKHEKHSEAHQIFRDQAGHAVKGLLPQTVNPVSSSRCYLRFYG